MLEVTPTSQCWLLSCKHDPHTTHSKAQETLIKRMQDLETWREAARCYLLGTIQSLQPCITAAVGWGSTQDSICQQSVRDGVGIHGTLLTMLNSWIYIYLEMRGHCVPTGKPTSLQQTVSNLQSHRHKITKLKDMNVGKGLVRRKVGSVEKEAKRV